MRTVRTKVYKFDELSKEAQETAIEKLWDLNVDYSWWELTYEDASQIGLKITSFDIDKGQIEGDLLWSCREIADAIISDHGNATDTFKLATNFLHDYDQIVTKYSDGVDLDRVAEDNEYESDQEFDELEENFKEDLLNSYLGMLENEYNYLISKEAITESIQANGYEFTQDGKMY